MSEYPSTPTIFTIGVYGFDENSFFQALQEAQIDTFCDVRDRRGMRGATYAFANSRRLQTKLQELGITYIHRRDLAPDRALRSRQRSADKGEQVSKRHRTALSIGFIDGYESKVLSDFDGRVFMEELGPQAQRVVLCCVEREPAACHRSILSKRLQHELGGEIVHLSP